MSNESEFSTVPNEEEEIEIINIVQLFSSNEFTFRSIFSQ